MSQSAQEIGGRIIVRQTITGAATNNGTMTVDPNTKETAYASDYPAFRGRYLLECVTIPSGAPDAPSAWTGSIDDTDGKRILTISTRSTSAVESLPGETTLGGYPVCTKKWTVTLTGIANTKKVTVEMVFA